MIFIANIWTDSLRISDWKEIEARSSLEATLAALHHETSAYKQLRDLPMARLRIEVWPAGACSVVPRSLNQEGGCGA